jgi:alanine racemase
MADDPASETATAQANTFAELTRSFGLLSRPEVDLHHANSGAALTSLSPVTGSVRVGIAMYGLQPGPAERLLPGMRPVMSLVSRLVRTHQIQPGDGVSYGHSYIASTQETVGLVPLGYADGYRRSFSNRAAMVVGGVRAPVRGRVCMDQTIIGNLKDSSRIGDVVGIWGPVGGGPSVDDLASIAGTINYEIVTALSSRVPRIYVRDGVPAGSLIEGELTSLPLCQ